jgi:VanZ family protein
MNKIKSIIFWWFSVFIWVLVIYYFSSQPGLKSELEPFWDLIFRKIAHMSEFFVLAYLLFRAYRSLGMTIVRSLFFALIFSLFYAFFDEWHQSQVAGRTQSMVDVGIDSLGILAFLVLNLLYQRK